MNDNNIDKFRAEIRKRLRDCQNSIGDEIVVNHSKFNEDLEFQLQQMGNELNPDVRDLLIQTGNYGYVQGVQLGLTLGGQRVKEIEVKVEELRTKIQNASSGATPQLTNDHLEDISISLSKVEAAIKAVGGTILIGILLAVLLFFTR